MARVVHRHGGAVAISARGAGGCACVGCCGKAASRGGSIFSASRVGGCTVEYIANNPPASLIVVTPPVAASINTTPGRRKVIVAKEVWPRYACAEMGYRLGSGHLYLTLQVSSRVPSGSFQTSPPVVIISDAHALLYTAEVLYGVSVLPAEIIEEALTTPNTPPWYFNSETECAGSSHR